MVIAMGGGVGVAVGIGVVLPLPLAVGGTNVVDEFLEEILVEGGRGGTAVEITSEALFLLLLRIVPPGASWGVPNRRGGIPPPSASRISSISSSEPMGSKSTSSSSSVSSS